MDVLRWWAEGGAVPRTEGLVGSMSFAPQSKSQWAMAVLDEAEPNHSHTPGNSSWDRLRRTMPPAARLLLQELQDQATRPAEGV